MPFPAVKLFSLFVKQLSKPLATYIKRRSKESYWIRTYICIPPAQLYHRMDVSLRMWASGSKKSKGFKVSPLEEPVAIDIGADLLGEVFIFSVGAGVLAFEYWRQTANAAKKEQKQDDSLVRLRKDINELTALVEAQQSYVEDLTNTLLASADKHAKMVPADRKEDLKKLRS